MRTYAMRTYSLRAAALAALLLFGAASVAAQTADPDDHDAHHPAEAPAAAPEAGTAAGMEGMSGMKGMMTPEMMKMMQGMMGGPGLLYGMPHGATEEMTPESVRSFLEKRLEWHANPRLKIGTIATAADGSITAEIVTVDGSLVQKLAFNRHPGLVRQIE